MTDILTAGDSPADPELIQSLRDAAKRGMTKEEMYKQRVNYIIGAMSDEKTQFTSDMVRRELEKLAGEAA